MSCTGEEEAEKKQVDTVISEDDTKHAEIGEPEEHCKCPRPIFLECERCNDLPKNCPYDCDLRAWIRSHEKTSHGNDADDPPADLYLPAPRLVRVQGEVQVVGRVINRSR